METKVYVVMWNGLLHGRVLEVWTDKETAYKRSKKFFDVISGGTSLFGYPIDRDRGISEQVTVEEITLNAPRGLPIELLDREKRVKER